MVQLLVQPFMLTIFTLSLKVCLFLGHPFASDLPGIHIEGLREIGGLFGPSLHLWVVPGFLQLLQPDLTAEKLPEHVSHLESI